MNILLSCIGKRGYLATYFRECLPVGSKIIGTSNTEWTPGFSKCDYNEILPDITDPVYIDRVLDVCKKHRIRLALSLYDPDLITLTKYHNRFKEAQVVLLHPSYASSEIGNDKLLTFNHLFRLGYNVPRTTDLLATALQMLEKGEMRYPLVVKPRCGFGSGGLSFVRDEVSLRAAFYSIETPIVQQFISGDEYNIDGLGSMGGEPLSVIPWIKRLSRLGETEQAIVVDEKELVTLGKKLISDLRIVGAFNVDIVRSVNGEWSIIEVNMRFGGGYPVCHFANANYPAKIVSLVNGDQLKWDGNFIIGATMMKSIEPIPGPVTFGL